MIILISGSGIGAGKTTLAKILRDKHNGFILSFAYIAKEHLAAQFKNELFLSPRQEDKNILIDGVSVRQHIINYCVEKKKNDPAFFARNMVQLIHESTSKYTTIIIDDMRYAVELHAIKKHFDYQGVRHIHVDNFLATPEPETDEKLLRNQADMIYRWFLQTELLVADGTTCS